MKAPKVPKETSIILYRAGGYWHLAGRHTYRTDFPEADHALIVARALRAVWPKVRFRVAQECGVC